MKPNSNARGSSPGGHSIRYSNMRPLELKKMAHHFVISSFNVISSFIGNSCSFMVFFFLTTIISFYFEFMKTYISRIILSSPFPLGKIPVPGITGTYVRKTPQGISSLVSNHSKIETPEDINPLVFIHC